MDCPCPLLASTGSTGFSEQPARTIMPVRTRIPATRFSRCRILSVRIEVLVVVAGGVGDDSDEAGDLDGLG